MALIDGVIRSFHEVGVRLRVVGSLIMGVWCCLAPMGEQAMGHESAGEETERGVVAAGFGYQNETGAAMTVKVYDALSGEVLSEDVYELIVEEDHGARSDGSSEGSMMRIFAGGTGGAPAGLSSFLLRAYDGKTGEFQWVGRLHFNPTERDGDEKGRQISTSMFRRATLTKIGSTVRSEDPYPLFILRAWDPSTGVLLWEDEFSSDEETAMSVGTVVFHATDCERLWIENGVVDFRILMVDREKGSVLWEDQVFQRMEEERQTSPNDPAQRVPDQTGPVDARLFAEQV
ncbi:MAG: PQQ-like beta-propeller repeat protein [Nitrospira sp.]|nr:PQQ-like beta-propeller repeat protein [Nitrospira sp.]MCP9442543.1 PQQ-like beta-propeller repeat protein [Nitrospira sp.]